MAETRNDVRLGKNEVGGTAAAALTRAGAVAPAPPARLEPGQLLARVESALPVQWLALDLRELPRRMVELAPVDTFGPRGTADLAVHEVSSSRELSVRGRHSVWIPLAVCSRMRLVGAVSPEDLQAVRRHREAATPPFSSLGVDGEADYLEWIEEITRPAVRELEELTLWPADDSPPRRPWAVNWKWRRAAAAGLLLGAGFIVGLGVAGRGRALPKAAFGRPEPSGSVFAPLSPLETWRADTEPELYRLEAGDRDRSLLLALRESRLEGALTLRFESEEDHPQASFEIRALEPILVGGARYVSVVVPSRSLGAGRWRLTLTGHAAPSGATPGDPGAAPLSYGLVVE